MKRLIFRNLRDADRRVRGPYWDSCRSATIRARARTAIQEEPNQGNSHLAIFLRVAPRISVQQSYEKADLPKLAKRLPARQGALLALLP